MGLDGATFDVLDGLADLGAMPELARMRRGCGRAVLRSTIPMYTLPSWTTLWTGLPPAEHGVLYWREGGPPVPWRVEEGGFTYLPSGRIPMLWDIAEAAGRKVGCIDIPLAFPASPAGELFTSGFMAPAGSPRMVSPPDLLDAFPTWVPEVQKSLTSSELRRRPDEAAAYVAALSAQTELRRQLLGEIGDDIDFLCIVNVVPDRLSHLDFDRLLAMAATGEAGDELTRCWQDVDALLGDALSWAGDDGTVLVVSDHGFARGPAFNVATWLSKAGLDGVVNQRALGLQRLAGRLLPARVGDAIRPVLRRRLGVGDELPISAGHRSPELWPISLDDRACYLYLRPDIKAARGDAVVRQVLDAALGRSSIPTGVAPFAECLSQAEAFDREDPGLPDVVLLPADDWILRTDHGDPRLSWPDGGSEHHRDGVLLARGPSVIAGAHEPADMGDMFATVLATLELPQPGGTSGTSVAWVHRPVTGQAVPTAPRPVADGVTPEEAVDLEAHLRSLGYLD
ncbi:MAG: type phosphodiesterase/nucleotide pyrophosphatase [Actinomycetia bacterium]|nr:type phosphodiesterase/nucleotide pyrophosphatase [Actinomycetes bacterium]